MPDNFFQRLIVTAFCLVIVTAVPTDVMAAKKKPAVTPPAQETPTQAPVLKEQPVAPMKSPAVSPITQAAVQAGALTCTSRINQIAAFLTGNTTSGAYLFINDQQPDQRIFSTSLELQAADHPAMYASASFASSPAGGCGAVYDVVEFLPQACSDVEKTVLKDLKRSGLLKKDIVVLDAGPMKFFLMPAGTGCVVIKKEIVE